MASEDGRDVEVPSNAWQIPVAGASAPATPMDAMSEKPTESSDAAFQEALLPKVDDSQFEEIKNNILDKMNSLQQKYGTITSYLQKRYADKVDLQAFAVKLHDMAQIEMALWTLKGKLSASTPDEVPESPVFLPLAAFSFDKNCSMKPDADHQLVLDLAERFLMEGFLSSNEPLLVLQTAELLQVSDQLGVQAPWIGQGSLRPFSLGFLKGKARLHTLMALMSIFVDNNIDPKQAAWQT